jgi:hypothetical protein
MVEGKWGILLIRSFPAIEEYGLLLFRSRASIMWEEVDVR